MWKSRTYSSSLFKRKSSLNEKVFSDSVEENPSIHLGNMDNLSHPLLVFGINLNNLNVNALLDSGASNDFISTRFVNDNAIKYVKINPIATRIATKVETPISIIGKVTLYMTYQGIKEYRDFYVLDLDKYDVILGMKFLKDKNPQVNWNTFQVKMNTFNDNLGDISSKDFGNEEVFNNLFKKLQLEMDKKLQDLKFNHYRNEDNNTNITSNNKDSNEEVKVIEYNNCMKDVQKNESCLVLVNEIQQHDSNSNNNIDNIQNNKIEEVIETFKDVFPEQLPNDLPPQRSIEHEIKLNKDSEPPNRSPYRLSFTEQDELKKQLKTLLDGKLIRPSSSPFGSPVLFVKKKSGELRMCIDYRALNNITVKNRYPLPRVDDLLDQLSQARYFSKLDLTSGYWQVRVKSDDTHKTAFRTRYGHYEFMVMPFGLCNAPSTFQHLMNSTFQDYLDDFVIIYLDDIMIYSKTFNDHLKHLEIVFQKLREMKLYAKLQKCEFAKEEVEYLGHIVGNKSIKPDPKKTQAIMEWPAPQNSKDVMAFVGLANFYRKFVNNFSKIVAPLTNIMSKKAEFKWKNEQQDAFDKIKVILTNSPVLKLPTRFGRFKVHTDASDIAIGAVLEQEDIDIEEIKPVAYFSQKLHGAQVRYPVHIKELYAIVKALENWRHYLEGQSFDVYTDHHSIQFLKTQSGLSKLQARWVEKLSLFDFELHYKPGKTNVVADGLSRLPQANAIDTNSLSETTRKTIKKKYLCDSDFKNIYEDLENNKEPPAELRHKYKHYKLINNLLVYSVIPEDNDTERLCVPKGKIRKQILYDNHDSITAGHVGYLRTYDLIHRYYYWPSMIKEIKNYVIRCHQCQINKTNNSKTQGMLQPLQIPKCKWEQISMDFITGLNKTKNGFDSIYVVIDYLSKRGHFIPCTINITGTEVAKLFINNIYKLHGLPKVIISDRDPRFIGNFWSSLMANLGVKLAFSSANHAQTDGQTERTNRTLEQMLRSFINKQQDNWDECLPLIEFAYNNSKSSTTGYTPFEVDTGINPIATGKITYHTSNPTLEDFIKDMNSLSNIALDSIKQSQDSQAVYANRKRSDLNIQIGDLVLLNKSGLTWKPSKLSRIWYGPYKVLSKHYTSFKLSILDTRMDPVIHASHLKKYHNPIQHRPSRNYKVNPVYSSEEVVLIGTKTINKQKFYLIKRNNESQDDAYWISQQDLETNNYKITNKNPN